ncbi:MAG: DUF362 domain-containing protein [Candidatus Marinimicrobia bacterium]|nr:DUF362 domain-containing protein [Candidatus Neomarinimicrobiota bacterium]MCF7827626.1 DUF362 domain-containing protein [Candidatus Neomarinimicrobiota bacterium]MCF7881319.1 DUF362 domain-containing protein [Candidatus Neomarinimicrobiota bacterium]
MQNLIKRVFGKYLYICPKTGKIRGINYGKGLLAKILFPVIGLLALIWFLIRVIPKPSRAGYPCMKVAMPLATGFLAWVAGLFTTVFAFKKAKSNYLRARYVVAGSFVLLGLVGAILVTSTPNSPALASYGVQHLDPNQPIGEAKGIFPGRVAWAHNPDATNEDCIPDEVGNAWWEEENNNQGVIDSMLSQTLQSVSGEETDTAAWEAIFRYHNETRGKGAVDYQPGEKIFIKINVTSSWAQNINEDLTIVENNYYGMSETSPHVVLSVLRQLVNVAGVAEEDIYIGDPMKHIYQHRWEKWHNEFPDIHYLDHNGWGDRDPVAVSDSPLVDYSDDGTVLSTGWWNPQPVYEDHLYTVFEESEYILNIPTMKGHERAGITLFAKNHFGSHSRDNANHLHQGLIAPDAGDAERNEYGVYRVLVDLMGHELIGKKTLIFILDGLWTTGNLGDQAELEPPQKWSMAPFNNDWTSSIFVSLDMVAIESVAFDLLRTEFNAPSDPPQLGAVDDYLEQAADSTHWPEDITYDPEGDGVPISSLGTHEHWNNAQEKQYSRNLDPENGTGIELIYIADTTTTDVTPDINSAPETFVLHENYPNPFNPSTNIRYELAEDSQVVLEVYNLAGQKVQTLVNRRQHTGVYTVNWDGLISSGQMAPSGTYLYRINVQGQNRMFSETKQMALVK